MTDAIAQSLPARFSVQFMGVKDVPSKSTAATTTFDIVTLAGSLLYMIILLQLLPVFLSNIVQEKESKVHL